VVGVAQKRRGVYKELGGGAEAEVAGEIYMRTKGFDPTYFHLHQKDEVVVKIITEARPSCRRSRVAWSPLYAIGRCGSRGVLQRESIESPGLFYFTSKTELRWESAGGMVRFVYTR
jgi:hypothetical protein